MDHVSRIPNPGDYFVFEFGIWDSVILVHDKAGEVKGYHNMCRHRGSRLCTHDTKFDNVRPGQATEDGKPVDARLSVVQLGGSGNTPVFRCPYHAWTYDLSGALVSLPPGMPSGFDQANYGLYPCHVRTTEGFIFVSFAEGEPPDFAAFTAGLTRVAEAYGTPDLKLAARRSYTLTTNWKLALENMRECDHCQPSHTRSFAGTHMIYFPTAGPDERARVEREMVAHGHPVSPRDIGYMTLPDEDRLYQASNMTGSTSRRASTGGMGGSGATGSHFRLGFVTGSFDGRPVGPVLPKRKGQEWSHRRSGSSTGGTMSIMSGYDDYVFAMRYTPRGALKVDSELFWFVHPDAKEGKDYDVEQLIAMWDLTVREDSWVAENQLHGIRSSQYHRNGDQPYSRWEGGPSGLNKWCT